MVTKAITKDVICREALTIISNEGLDNLSMRNLATRLNIKTPSLYARIQNKANLIVMVQAYAFRAHDLTGSLNPDSCSWQDYIYNVMQNMRQFFLSHPALFELFASYSSNSDESRLVFEWFLQKMQNSGFTLEQAAYLGRSMRVYVLGHVKFELGNNENSKKHPKLPQNIQPEFALNYTFFVTNSGYDDTKSFNFGVKLLISGAEKLLDEK
jgi:AcrR family transcriptional regulator